MKTKALSTCAVTAQLICISDFAMQKSWFSQEQEKSDIKMSMFYLFIYVFFNVMLLCLL